MGLLNELFRYGKREIGRSAKKHIPAIADREATTRCIQKVNALRAKARLNRIGISYCTTKKGMEYIDVLYRVTLHVAVAVCDALELGRSLEPDAIHKIAWSSIQIIYPKDTANRNIASHVLKGIIETYKEKQLGAFCKNSNSPGNNEILRMTDKLRLWIRLNTKQGARSAQKLATCPQQRAFQTLAAAKRVHAAADTIQDAVRNKLLRNHTLNMLMGSTPAHPPVASSPFPLNHPTPTYRISIALHDENDPRKYVLKDFDVQSTWTISRLKVILASGTGIKFDDQRIIFDGNNLDNTTTLQDAKIVAGSTIHVVKQSKQ